MSLSSAYQLSRVCSRIPRPNRLSRMSNIATFIRSSWKAVVALLIPIAFGAAADMITVLSDWVLDQGFVWGGLVAGLLTSIGVWFKANRI